MKSWQPILFLLLALLIALPATTSAEDKPDTKEETKSDDDKDAKKKKKKIKPYDEIIPEDAISRKGLIHTHRVEEKLFFEIPEDTLDLELLWVTQIAETTGGSSYAGMPVGDRVVRWEKRGDQILLRGVHYGIRAQTDDPISRAVKASNLAPIIRVFDIKAFGKDKAPVIEVTALFNKDVPEFSAGRSLGAGSMDSGRSFVEEVKSFQANVEIRVLASYAPGKPSGSSSSSGPSRSSGITALIHHSLVKLPEDPMQPREEDSRIGYFSVGFVDYADDSDHEAKDVRYITRWRLEKKDPKAELSEPIKPIVFYVGRAVPEKWRSYVKQGIEDWIPAFEAAGFKNAIQGKYAPDPRDDPDWDAEDARISTIRWLPSNIENAFGPHVHDPRTGEILEADVRMYHNIQKLVRDWYFVQASPNDKRAQKLPLPDDLVGELIRFVVAHEVGHSIGLPHNMKASSAYSIEQLRDPEWTKKNGTAPSIMDYARFNYVAQPEDGASLTPGIGPYDHFSINWGYRQFAKDATEKEELEKIAHQQVDNPILRFGGRNPSVDATQQTEDLGADAVEATRLGLKNLERVAGYLVEATSRKGEDYSLLSNMYDQLLGQWGREMGHVVNVVGGVQEINLYFGDADQRFFPVSKDYQKKAVQFLIKNALSTPDKFVTRDIVRRITQQGVAQRVSKAQNSVLGSLVNDSRIKRMSEITEENPEKAYSPATLLGDLRKGLFSEIMQGDDKPMIDLYRRNLQRTYIDTLAKSLAKPATDSDLPALARLELKEIRVKLDGASTRSNGVTRAHLMDLISRIDLALDPRLAAQP